MSIPPTHPVQGTPPSPASPATSPGIPPRSLEDIAGLVLRFEPIWAAAALTLVILSYVLGRNACLPWVGLLLAAAPFPLRRLRVGYWARSSHFDLPIAILLVGALVGLIVSPDRTISLGAFQLTLAMTLFYFSFVSYPNPALLIKRAMALGLVILGLCVILVYVDPHPFSGRPDMQLNANHGFAMTLILTLAVVAGMVLFHTNMRLRLVGGLFCIAVFVGVFVMTDKGSESIRSLFSLVSFENRIPIWRETISMLGESPATGLGLGCWLFRYVEYYPMSHYTHVHNAYLELYSNTGVFGAAALVATLVIGYKLAMDIFRAPRHHPWYGFGIGVVSACALAILIGVIETAPTGMPIVAPNTYYYLVSPVPWFLGILLLSAHRLIRQSD